MDLLINHLNAPGFFNYKKSQNKTEGQIIIKMIIIEKSFILNDNYFFLKNGSK